MASVAASPQFMIRPLSNYSQLRRLGPELQASPNGVEYATGFMHIFVVQLLGYCAIRFARFWVNNWSSQLQPTHMQSTVITYPFSLPLRMPILRNVEPRENADKAWPLFGIDPKLFW